MKHLIFLLFFSVSATVGAADKREVAYQLLKSDLKKLTKTLSRDIKLYHWGDSNIIHTAGVSPSDSSWKSFFLSDNGMLTSFFGHDNSPDLVGGGIYLSADPYKSRDYGDTLVELTVKAGSNFLDTRSNLFRKIGIRFETFDALKAVCSDLTGQKNLSKNQVLMNKNDLQKFGECRHILNKVFSDLKIQFYSYYWKKNNRYGPCVEDNTIVQDVAAHIAGGLITVHSDNVDDYSISFESYEVKVFGPNFGSNQSSHNIKKLIDNNPDYSSAFYIDQIFRIQGKTPEAGLWDIFDGLGAWKQEELSSKMKVNWFGCGNRYPEDLLDSPYLNTLRIYTQPL